MRRAMMGVLLASVAACGAVVETSRSEQTREKAEEVYGAPGPASAPGAFAQSGDNTGLSMFRVFSEKPMPTQFSSRAPEMFENSLVMDVAVDVELEQGFPLYRIGLVPQRLEGVHTATWDSFVKIETGGAGTNVLAARLPSPWPPGADGVIWTDWTYCADCFGLKEIEAATPANRAEAFAALTEARAAARSRNGAATTFSGEVTFTGLPGVGILQGDAARQMAGKAADLVAKSQARMTAMGPARKRYFKAVAEMEDSASPRSEIVRICGVYAPNTELFDPRVEERRITAYQACGRQALEEFDRAHRRETLAAYTALEARLAAKAGLTAEERTVVPGLREEMAEARTFLQNAEDRYLGREMRRGDTASVAATPGAGVAEVTERARRAIERAPVPVEQPEATRSQPEDAPESTAQDADPEREVHYAARLLPEGANLDRGAGGDVCIGDVTCETGSIAATIAATSYCRNEGGLTETEAGWGLVGQRYLPETRAEEKRILEGGGDQVHLVRDGDEAALQAGLAAMRDLTDPENGEQVFFTSYQSFYEVNTEKLGCRDQWRDAAKVRVRNNPPEFTDR